MKANKWLRGLLLLVIVPVMAWSTGSIVSGPMLGYQAHREVFIWLETKGTETVKIDYWQQGESDTKQSIIHHKIAPYPAGSQIHHFRPGLLKTGVPYEYSITIDGVQQELDVPTSFQTQPLWEWRTAPPDFSFLVGSCAFINEPEFDRPGEGYGKTTRTLELMGESKADFMIWTGDNWYWREPDYDSISGLWYRPSHDRAIPEMKRLLASMHHYATWDDHDYGPNDSNWSYEYKETALDIFKAYWGNHSYGEAHNPGVYSKFYWGDAAFFLMDNHYYRDAAGLDQDKNPGKTKWGRQQLDWLKQSLMAAKELNHFKFLFIATGNQMLQSTSKGESHELYRHEREELMNFILENGLTGIVFLTGDVHFSAMYQREIGDKGQKIYEITSSPITSGAWTNIAETPGGTDPALIPGTIVNVQNFVQIKITGEDATRTLNISCVDKDGTVCFTRDIKATELGYQPRKR